MVKSQGIIRKPHISTRFSGGFVLNKVWDKLDNKANASPHTVWARWGWLIRLHWDGVQQAKVYKPNWTSLCFGLSVWHFVCLFVSLTITATTPYRMSCNLESTNLVQRRTDVYVRIFIPPPPILKMAVVVLVKRLDRLSFHLESRYLVKMNNFIFR